MRFQFGDENKKQATGSTEKTSVVTDDGKVSLPLSEVYDALCDAIGNNRTWLQDFQDDEITISQDLYDVIKAYQRYRQAA
jgi:hypothetical protein